MFYAYYMNHRITKAQVKWVRQLQQKKFRDAEGLFVAEGEKCVNDLQDAFELVLHISPENASQTEIEQMSSLRTPQGVIGVFKQRETIDYGLLAIRDGLLLALDGVQDPGNLGTIIRTCDWFGIHHILCSRDTADCYNPKVVQATMGALARVHIHYMDDLADALLQLKKHDYPIYGTLLDGKNLYANGSIADKQKGVIIMGNEGNGISPKVRATVTHPLLIPSYETMKKEAKDEGRKTSESLNVGIATAIVLAEFRRIETP